jgi:glycosyltransferase involved in cell wall biosynthesis
MPTLSVAMIVRDEADKLAGVLADANGFCDELVVVDTGSTDDTMEIARAAGAIVHEFEWIDDFATARNYSFDQCTGDWIIWLDADDRLPAEVQAAIRAIKPTLTDDLDAVLAEYRLWDTNGVRVLTRFDRERLLRRAAGLRWGGEVHEAILVPDGRWVRSTEIYVEHRPAAHRTSPSQRNLRILQNLIAAGDASARNLFYLGNELVENGRHAEAVDAYERYLAATIYPWERYSARVFMSTSLSTLGRYDEAFRQSIAAIGDDPSRAEAYVKAGIYFYDRQDWPKALPLFLAATEAQRPIFGFAIEADYTYLPWDYLGTCYYKLGRSAKAIEALKRAIELGSPEPERLEANVRHAEELVAG